MKWQPWIGSILVGLGVASCGENTPPPAQSNHMGNAGFATRQPTPADSPGRIKAVSNDAPVPPKGAQWTILCDTVTGPAHVEQAQLLKAHLIEASGMPGWYVIHEDNQSTLYYGYYRSLNEPAEKIRAEQDRAKIAALTDRLGNRLVRGGVLVAVSPPDPQGPPEWNLLNAPKDAYWTIEIASFSGNPKRKEAAVQMVRELREKGEKDAYYYNGSTASSVCIGAWPRDAVAEQGTGLNRQGAVRDDAHTQSPDQTLFVFGDKAPDNVPGRVYDPATGKPMVVEGLKLEIQNPDMKKKAVEYPYHFINYELHGVQNNGQTFPDQSFLTVIPRHEAGTGQDDWQLAGPTRTPAPAGPAEPTSAGDSVLRSLGDK